MIEIKPHIVRSGRQIEEKYGVRNWLELIHTDKQYVDIDNVEEVYEIIHDDKFSTRHIQMLFTITYDQEVIAGFNVPSALDLWLTYLNAAEEVINYGESRRQYGIDPYIIELKSLNQEFLHLSIYQEFDISNKCVDAHLPYQAFLVSLLKAIQHFYTKMNNDYDQSFEDEGIEIRIENLICRVVNYPI